MAEIEGVTNVDETAECVANLDINESVKPASANEPHPVGESVPSTEHQHSKSQEIEENPTTELTGSDDQKPPVSPVITADSPSTEPAVSVELPSSEPAIVPAAVTVEASTPVTVAKEHSTNAATLPPSSETTMSASSEPASAAAVGSDMPTKSGKDDKEGKTPDKPAETETPSEAGGTSTAGTDLKSPGTGTPSTKKFSFCKQS